MTDGFLSYICVVVYLLRTAASRSHGRLSIIRLCTCTSIVHGAFIRIYREFGQDLEIVDCTHVE